MNTANEYKWRIAHIDNENTLVKSLYLEPVKDKPAFKAGQYVTVKLPNLGPAEGKSYSISSAPHEDLVRLTVKKIGVFSSALLSLQVGDTLHTSAPYGFFFPEPDDTVNLVFLAGGIGITPCLSIIKDLVHKNDQRNINLFYSNHTERDITFREELLKLDSIHQSLHTHFFITRETQVCEDCQAGRFTPEKILERVTNHEKADLFLCGSMDFTKTLWKDLRNAGIPPHQLYTEGFF